jgi:hypothetical protein
MATATVYTLRVMQQHMPHTLTTTVVQAIYMEYDISYSMLYLNIAGMLPLLVIRTV